MKSIFILLLCLLLSSCEDVSPRGSSHTDFMIRENSLVSTPSELKVSTPTELHLATPSEKTLALASSKLDLSTIDLSLKPNESGKIMVLMYHNLGEQEDYFVRTPKNFRKDLETLYKKGYRPISLKDYVKGQIHTQAGYTPVVITVDDGMINNFCYEESGEIDPNCMVGILLSFHEEHLDFPIHTTFFATGSYPFGQEGMEKQKINFLLEHGMDLGNHTKGHEDLTHLSGKRLQETIGAQAAFLQSLSPEHYEIDTLALPYGSRPQKKELETYLREGTYGEFLYKNVAILDVGWDPWYSPFHQDFNPYGIHRITASEMGVEDVGLYDWIKYFDEHPEERFISDGNPEILTIPSSKKDIIQVPEGMKLYAYEEKE